MGKANRWVGQVVVFAALATTACGSSSSNSGSPSSVGGSSGSDAAAGTATGGGAPGAHAAGSGALSGSAGTSNPSGGSGGLAIGDSPTEACIAYVIAQCQRRTQCAGSDASVEACMEQTNSCPDSLFSDGSTRTVAGLNACAAEFATFPCDQLNLGFVPDCVTPGTRQPGEACVFNAQCTNVLCDTQGGTCGKCYALAALGEDCGAAGVACGPGLSCNQGQCITLLPSSPDDLSEGKPCSAGFGCNKGLYCVRSSNLCTKEPTLGMPCGDAEECADDSYCSTAQPVVCSAPPSAGQPCGADPSGALHCSADSVCSFTDASHIECLALPSAGQPCVKVLSADLTTKEEDCAAGSFCDATSTCVAPGAPGASCQADPQCQAGLSCRCADGTHDGCASTALTCARVGFANDPCGVPGAVCHPGFTCSGGSCTPRASQGLFAAACGAH